MVFMASVGKPGRFSIFMVRPAMAGFTLLEMLVTLVIISLLMVLLMQGLLYALQLRTRTVEQQQRQRITLLQEHWFRSSSAALAPGKADQPEVFSGDRTGFKGLSLAPVLGEVGAPILIEWRLANNAEGVVLRYRQGKEQPGWPMTRWDAATEAGFRYRDDAGQWLDRWPPAGLTQSATEPAALQLPTAIELAVVEASGPRFWLSIIAGRREPKMDVQEWLLTPNLVPDF